MAVPPFTSTPPPERIFSREKRRIFKKRNCESPFIRKQNFFNEISGKIRLKWGSTGRGREFYYSERRSGYPDPTAGAALKFGYRPVVYICSKYRGDVETNVYNAQLYSRYAVEQGYIPIAPHLLLPQFVDEETERDLALFMGRVLMSKCS